MTNSFERADNTWLARAAQWLKTRGEAWAACRELDNCGEAARLAQDCGIPLSDLRRIALRGPDGAKELVQMLEANGIDPDALDKFRPAIMRDLQHHCCLCDHKTECRDELAAGRAADTFQDFCSNASTLEALKKG